MMSVGLFGFFAFYFLTQFLFPVRHRLKWFFFVSALCLYNVNDQFLVMGLVLLLVNEGIKASARRLSLNPHALLPLIYCALLITVNHLLKKPIVGGSYVILAASLDLMLHFNKVWDKSVIRQSGFNLLSYPKSSLGPIQDSAFHFFESKDEPLYDKAAIKVGLGLSKVFLFLPLFRDLFPKPFLDGEIIVLDFLGYGLWNYIILYLEFSGVCDLVVACFAAAGLNCRENFDTPYFSLSITEFWKRWHISLGHWIRQHVYIAFGGNRVGNVRLYLNLFLAMLICGAWHGITFNFILWGTLQGFFMVFERAVSWEKKWASASLPLKSVPWLVTQLLVIASWAVFFNWKP